ncbi:probable methyltransferase [Tanacetum coccineum]
MKNNRGSRPDGRFFIIICVAAVIGGIFLLPSFIGIGDRTPLFCSESISEEFYPSTTTPLAHAKLDHCIMHLHKVVPHANSSQIMVVFRCSRAEKAPCNFLIFGLGYDSLMWAAFNPKGKTLFLEEDPLWVRSILKTAPNLNEALEEGCNNDCGIEIPPAEKVTQRTLAMHNASVKQVEGSTFLQQQSYKKVSTSPT